jgi:hypothetical protein
MTNPSNPAKPAVVMKSNDRDAAAVQRLLVRLLIRAAAEREAQARELVNAASRVGLKP